MAGLKPFVFSAPVQGVQVKPLVGDGTRVRIRYSGALMQQGATELFIRRGFGDIREWRQVEEQPMELVSGGFEQTVDVKDCQMNFCFRDTASNWDNNYGQNWIYMIT